MVHCFNPLTDPRWPSFLSHHPRASVFHGRPWLEALRRTYGYEPIVYSACSPSSELTNGIVFCRVDSWLTGHRLVSLPFSDHCEPLIDDAADRDGLWLAVQEAVEHAGSRRLKYVEIRPLQAEPWQMLGATPTESFALHSVDLRPSLDQIYQRTHKSTFQRKILRARRERLTLNSGNSESLLNAFYFLLLKTRRRHGLPPQSMKWFQNLAATMRDQLTVWVASKENQPIAALLTLSWRSLVVYKYGCSDARYHHFGGVPFLFWTAIQKAKQDGIETFDLGRSDLRNTGLITFKDRLGAATSDLVYLRYGATRSAHRVGQTASRAMSYLFARMPDRLLTTTGSLLYRHIG